MFNAVEGFRADAGHAGQAGNRIRGGAIAGALVLVTCAGLWQGLGHAAFEGVHQAQDRDFFRDGCGQRAALQLGLDQGSELFGSVVAVVRPADGLAGGVDEQACQLLFFRGSLRDWDADGKASAARSCSGKCKTCRARTEPLGRTTARTRWPPSTTRPSAHLWRSLRAPVRTP